jgi:hypothetical protein
VLKDGNGSGSCGMADFGIVDARPMGYDARILSLWDPGKRTQEI